MPVTINGGRIPVKAARVLLGIRGHRPSAFNIDIGKCMKAGNYKPNDGGMYDTTFQGHFISCAISAGANVGEAGRRKASGGR